MAKYHSTEALASDPGQLSLSRSKLWRQSYSPVWKQCINRLTRKFAAFEEQVAEHLMMGDSRAAIIMSLDPLLVASFTDELDCIAMLRFKHGLVEEYGLSKGDRLLTVNTYVRGSEPVASDLEPGPLTYGRYVNFYPVIAEFTSDDMNAIALRKADIPEDEWSRCRAMGLEYLAKHPDRTRFGSAFLSMQTADHWKE